MLGMGAFQSDSYRHTKTSQVCIKTEADTVTENEGDICIGFTCLSLCAWYFFLFECVNLNLERLLGGAFPLLK